MSINKKLEMLEKKIEEIWRNNIYEDITNDWVRFEADLCSSLYYHIRNFFNEHQGFENWRIIQQEDKRDFAIYEIHYKRDKNQESQKPLKNYYIYMEVKHIAPDYIKSGYVGMKDKKEIEKDLKTLLDSDSEKIEYLKNHKKIDISHLKRYFMYVNYSTNPFFRCEKCNELYKISPKNFNCPKCDEKGDPLWFFKDFKKNNNYKTKLKVFYAYLLRPKKWFKNMESYHIYEIPKELFGYELI